MPGSPVDLGVLLRAAGTGPAAFDVELAQSAMPLALFPVRLETRFFALPDGAVELRVRIYPDKIHIDSHDPALSADETASGKRFWEAHWRAGNDLAGEREAWRELAGRFGPERAAWVARALDPTNPKDHPAVPVTGPLATPPAFPDLGPPAPFQPMARLLPDRWIATAYVAGAAAAIAPGQGIPAELPIAPDLARLVPEDDETPAIDDGMLWMIDFDRAEKQGMALRLRLPGPLSAISVDLLLVTGVRNDDCSVDLQRQLDAHHYTDGLAFVPPGVASNNIAGERSDYRAPDPRHEKSFDHEWGPMPAAGSRADLAARAFGIKAFDRLAGAAAQDEPAARAMMTATWPVTWGYFLAQMIGFEGELTLAARDWVRAHAIRNLRPTGPLPTLRCGRQPYGVLPVTSLDAWQPGPGSGDARRLAELLANLRDKVWRPAAAMAPRVVPGGDANADLVEILKTGPISSGFRVRSLMGQHFLQHLRAFMGEDLDSIGFWERLLRLTSREARTLGIDFVPALAHAAYDEVARPITVPMVGNPAYIADLLATTNVDALVEPRMEPVPLLHALLRHGLLREHVEAAARLLDSPAAPRATLVRDTELVDLVPGHPPTPTWFRLRDREVDGVPVRNRLATDPGLGEMKRALATLAATEPLTLERHLAATLDTTSHRLDAWITSLATWRLQEIREAKPVGIMLGGYGWLKNLRPLLSTQTVSDPPPDEPGPLFVPAQDPGFIHAPSLNQAAAAALLRNAHLAHGGEAASPYAIDLTSTRLRLAKHLFAGVRQGQPLGALLGYHFERSLHEARPRLDDLIDRFRSLAPLPGAETPEGVRRLVVDGLALSRRWQANRKKVLVAVRLSDGSARGERVARILDQLAAMVDAAADAVNAEAAFQMVRGNLPRAAASLEMISSGEAPPPELTFMATPRTGVSVTHRVALMFSAESSPSPAGWASSSPRSRADPALAAWAGRLLGPADAVAARVEMRGPDETVVASRLVPVRALNLTPIDLIWATGGADGAPPEVVRRVLDAAIQAPDSLVPAAPLRVDLSRGAGVEAGFGDLVEVATRAQRLLAGARPLHGADLQPPGADPDRGLDLDEFEMRVDAAEAALTQAHRALTDAVSSGEGLRAAMLEVAAFGVEGAIPTRPAADAAPGPALAAQAAVLLAETARRTAPSSDAAPEGEAARLDRLLERVRTVFGPGFLALPRFKAANAAEIARSRADVDGLLGDDRLAPYTWLQRLERVRISLARMARPLRQSEILGLGEPLDLAVAQCPHKTGQPWIGLKVTDTEDDRISLMLQGAPDDLDQDLCGLLVDEWTEIVPNPTETTGIAFQYDLPDSAASQAILLAMPPTLGEAWRLGSLNRVLLETLDLAHLRAVRPDDLTGVGHYLPAAYLAFNLLGDAVSTDLRPLAP